jgi:hypothetical protein
MPEETYEQFQQWLAKAQQEGRRKRLDEAPPPGMRPDGTIEFLEPGQPKPQPKVIKRFPPIRRISATCTTTTTCSSSRGHNGGGGCGPHPEAEPEP